MPSEKDILIVEDSPTQALLLKHLLESYPYPVSVARNGAEALVRIRERPPLLVISDFIMPGTNGRDLCLQVRNDPALKAIPFILMTAQSDPVTGLEPPEKGGPDAFLAKPVAREQLDQILAMLLTRKGSPAAPDLAVSDSEPAPETDLPVFDGRRLKENIGGDIQLYHRIIATFVEEFPKRFASLEQALKDGNRQVVELIAHSIKGAATTIGGERLQMEAMAMEKSALSAELAKLREMLAPLLQEYERLNAVLLSDLPGDMGSRGGAEGTNK